MRLNSIRARTLLLLVLICVAIVCTLGGLWLYTTSQNIKSSVFATDLHSTDLMANYVLMYVESVKTPLVLASGEMETADAIRQKNMTKAQDVFEHIVNATPQDDVAYMLDSDGRLLYSTCSTTYMFPVEEAEEFDGHLKNKTYITDLYYSDQLKGYTFAILSPVMDNSSVVGYVCDEVQLAGLKDFFIKQNIDPVHNIMLVDRNGMVIINNDPSLMEAHADMSSYPPVAKALAGQEGVIEHLWSPGPMISAYAPVPDMGWGIVVTTRSSVAYRPLLDQLIQLLGVCAIMIVALAAVGFMASTYLTDPIEGLSKAMAGVANGDYSVSLRARRGDEIGDLQHTFDSLVTQIKERDEVIRSQKERSEFYLDLMSHDINNMDQAGMGYLELAMDSLKGKVGPGDLEYLEKAYGVMKNSSGLIDNVRNIQKIQAGEVTPLVIDLGLMLHEVEVKYAHYPGRAVTINYAPPAGCRIKACSLFKEVFFNIVDNSIKHSDPSKPLTITMSLARVKENGRDFCLVIIEDDGPGIPDELKGTIFARYKRGKTSTEGKGLGLYIVQMLVEEFGGKVWAEDRVPGDYTKGARFIVSMPAMGATIYSGN